MVLLLQLQCRCDAVMRDLTERKDGLELHHRRDLSHKEPPAGLDLEGQGFVLGRHATHRVRYAHTDELEPIIAPRAVSSTRQPVPLKRAVQQFSRVVAGERACGAVGTFQPRSQTYDQEFRIERAEAWNRIVVEVREGFAVLVTEVAEPWTQRTIRRRFVRRLDVLLKLFPHLKRLATLRRFDLPARGRWT